MELLCDLRAFRASTLRSRRISALRVERLVATELHGATEKGSLQVRRYLAWARYNPDQAAGIEPSEDNL